MSLTPQLQILEEGILLFLQQSPTVVAMTTAQGIYFNVAPQNAPATCLVIQLTSTVVDPLITGPSGWNTRRYQFRCCGRTYVDAKRLQETLRLAMDGFGPDYLPNGQRVNDIRRDSEQDLFSDQGDAHEAITDYYFDYYELTN